MIREEIKDNIYFDDDDGFCGVTDFGYDQVYDSFPCVFPTVCCHLSASSGLIALIDEIIRNREDMIDHDNSYNFYINLNGYNDKHIDTYITVWVSNNLIYANCYDILQIDLSEEEQDYVYNCINDDIDCEDLLRQSADYFKADRGELTILERR